MVEQRGGVNRRTVDLTGYLIVIYLGMWVRAAPQSGQADPTGRQIQVGVAQTPTRPSCSTRTSACWSHRTSMRQYWRI